MLITVGAYRVNLRNSTILNGRVTDGKLKPMNMSSFLLNLSIYKCNSSIAYHKLELRGIVSLLAYVPYQFLCQKYHFLKQHCKKIFKCFLVFCCLKCSEALVIY